MEAPQNSASLRGHCLFIVGSTAHLSGLSGVTVLLLALDSVFRNPHSAVLDLGNQRYTLCSLRLAVH